MTAADQGGEEETLKNQRGFSLQIYAVGDIIHLIHKLSGGISSDNCHHNWKNIIMHPLRIRRIHHCGAKPADDNPGAALGQGNSDSYANKMRSRTVEGKLNRMTKIGGIAVGIVSFALVLMQSL